MYLPHPKKTAMEIGPWSPEEVPWLSWEASSDRETSFPPVRSIPPPLSSSLLRRHDASTADIGMNQNRIMSRLRLCFFSLESWVDLKRKIGKHFESWVDLIQYLVIHLSHELILSQFLESRLSHNLNRIKSLRYCLSLELISINLSGRHLRRKPNKVIPSHSTVK